jgi:putative ABC transport system permease protein
LYENALLRALGAKKQILTGALALEFAALGAGAGLLSVAGAELTAWILQSQVLELRYHSTPELWPVAIVGGVLLIASFGVVSCRRATRVAPLRVLRELA